MTPNIQQMIELYIEQDKNRSFHEIDIYKRCVLEEFIFYQEKEKGKLLHMSDVRCNDWVNYLNYLKSRKKDIAYIINRMYVLNDFIGFIAEQGWLY